MSKNLLDPPLVIRPTIKLSKLSMLPGFLESTYKKYKNDTSLFVKWLCEAGSKCGHAISIVKTAQGEPATKAPRLKGKARKEAKQANNSGSPSTAPECSIIASQHDANYIFSSL
jgi:hypothetical protein